ncbi:hypothetical protein [Pseudomonas aeruginosa]|uniref:hypothetical protein n=1 Tax=Pseudomonas aeruginosa TaxID=287 RepID=UPI0012FDB1FB|nr:hypothetical protein [Pseudomonas aeruginosa]
MLLALRVPGRSFRGGEHGSLFVAAVFEHGICLRSLGSFYWRIAYPDGQFRYESAEAACQANNDYYRKDYGSGYSRIEVRNKPIDETHWSCYLYAYKLDSKGVEYLAGQRGNNATRYGTDCPAGTEYDPATGGCKVNNCIAGLLICSVVVLLRFIS